MSSAHHPDDDVSSRYSLHDTEGQAVVPLLEPGSEERDDLLPAINRTRVYILLFTILIAVNLSMQILVPSQVPLFESIYCRSWFLTHDPSQVPSDGSSIPERLCKIPAVQKEVSTLRANMEVLESVPSLFLAIPFGMLADKVGRKHLFVLNVVIFMLRQFWITFVLAFNGAIPMGAIYIQAALNVLCGGLIVAELLFCVIITDITPRNELSNKFFQLTAANAVPTIVGPFISGALMRISPWVPILVGLALLVITTMLSFFVPETLPIEKKSVDSKSMLTSAKSILDSNETVRARLKNVAQGVMKTVREFGVIWTDWRLIFLAAIYPVRMLTGSMHDLMQRYVSNRYDWTLANSTLLNSLQAGAATCVLLFVMPRVTKAIDKRYGFSTLQKDVFIARVSFGLLAFGYLIEGIAPNIGILLLGMLLETLGAGGGACLRAIAGSLVPPEDNGRLFSGMAISETLSNIIAFKLAAVLFNIGLEKPSKMWLGLPYDVTAVALAVTGLAMCLLRFEKKLYI